MLYTNCLVLSTPKITGVRNRSRQLAEIFTFPKNISKRKNMLIKKIKACTLYTDVVRKIKAALITKSLKKAKQMVTFKQEEVYYL